MTNLRADTVESVGTLPLSSPISPIATFRLPVATKLPQKTRPLRLVKAKGQSIPQFPDRQAVGAGLDQLAEGRQAPLVAKGTQGDKGGIGVHDSNIPELWK